MIVEPWLQKKANFQSPRLLKWNNKRLGSKQWLFQKSRYFVPPGSIAITNLGAMPRPPPQQLLFSSSEFKIFCFTCYCHKMYQKTCNMKYSKSAKLPSVLSPFSYSFHGKLTAKLDWLFDTTGPWFQSQSKKSNLSMEHTWNKSKLRISKCELYVLNNSS